MGCCFSKNELHQISSDNYKNKISITSISKSCYSILHCLSYTKELTKYFLNKYDYNNNNNKVSNEYYNLLINLWKEKNFSYLYSPYNLTSFINNNRNSSSNNNQLNDGKSLLIYLFDNIHNELNTKNNNKGNNIIKKPTLIQSDKQLTLQIFFDYFKNNYNSVISNLFYGTYEIIFNCVQCEKPNYKYEIFNFLEFSLNEIDSFFGIKMNTVIDRGLRFKSTVKIIELSKCFEYHNKEKAITTKKYKCIFCNNEQFFNFSSKIFSMPNYLILILNNEKGNAYKVNYPEILDMEKYITHNEIASDFSLYSVIEKKDKEDEYIAYCRDFNNIWYKYDNNEVRQCQNKEYLKVLPCFLFYEVINK